MNRLLSRIAATALLLFVTLPAFAAPIPITGSGPVAGENIPTTAQDGSTVNRPAQVVVIADEDGVYYEPGDASAANQAAGNALLTTIDASLNDIETVQEGGTLATAANQTTGNSTLSTINTTLGSQATAAGQTTAAGILTTINASDDDIEAALENSRTPVAAAAATATQGVLQGCEYRTTPSVFTNTQQGAILCNASGETAISADQMSSGDNASATSAAIHDRSGTSRSLRVDLSAFDGSTWDRVRGTAEAGLWVQGNTADDAAATTATNPVIAGGVYETAPPTYAAGDVARLHTGSRGALHVQIMQSDSTSGALANWNADDLSASTGALPTRSLLYVLDGTTMDRVPGNSSNGVVVQMYATQASRWNYAAAAGGITNTTTAVTIKAAAGAGIRNCVSSMQLRNTAIGTPGELVLRDGAAGTVLWRGYQSTSEAYREVVFEVPLCGTANTLLEVATLTASGTGSAYWNVQGFVGP